MTARHDILDRRDSLKSPFAGSILIHGSLAAAVVIYGLLPASETFRLGERTSIGGSSVSVNPVSRIPMPANAARANPLANDTQSQVPAPPPQPQAKPKPEPPPDTRPAVALEGREAARRPPAPASSSRTRLPPAPPKPNQVYSQGGAAMSSPMLGGNAVGGGVGIGQGSPLGDGFGWYATIIQNQVAQAWKTSQVDPSLTTAPMVIVTFEIQRDGTVRDVRFLQRSGHQTLDYSAQRAVMDASPLRALPPNFPKDSIRVEFWFELKR